MLSPEVSGFFRTMFRTFRRRRARGVSTSAAVCAAKVQDYQGLNGAGDRDRTDDIQLGKLTFYH
jgi:hypothetical protein